MRLRLAALVAVALAPFITAGCAQRSSRPVAERTASSSRRQTWDIRRLRLNVRGGTEHFPENEALRAQTQRAIGRLCAHVTDRQAAAQVAGDLSRISSSGVSRCSSTAA
jgi:hypothetical protein